MQNGGSYKVPTTLDEVRAYVSGQSEAQVPLPGTIYVGFTHSNLTKTAFSDLRLDEGMRIFELKSKLYTQCGTTPSAMKLVLRSGERGPVIRELSDENATLAAYDVRSGQTIHVIDTDPTSLSRNGMLENTEGVVRYKMSEEAYNARKNTARKIREEKMKDPAWAKQWARTIGAEPSDIDSATAPAIGEGDRVEVFPGGRRGSVKYVGKDLKDMPAGWWIGVAYDEPVGKNDGTVKGQRYFTCHPGFGGFVRPSKVTVGDYPPLADDDEDSEEEL